MVKSPPPPPIFQSPAKTNCRRAGKEKQKRGGGGNHHIPQIKIFHFSPHPASPFSRKYMSLPISDTPFQGTLTWAFPGNPALGCPQAGRQPIPGAFCILNSQNSLSPFERNLKSSLGGLAWLGLVPDPLPLNCPPSGTGLRAGLSAESSQAGERQSSPRLASCSHQRLLPPSSTFLR